MKKLLALLFILSLVAVTPAFAQDDKTKTPTKEDIILKKLDDLQKPLDGISKDLRKDVDDNKKEIAKLRADFESLKADIAALKSSKGFKRSPPRTETVKTSYYNPPEVQYGKVRFVNTYHLGYNVTVNGEKHYVKAGDTVIVDYVMPGEFTYQVIGVTDVRKRTLSPNEMFTVTIHPQPQQTRSYGGYQSVASHQPCYTPPPPCYYYDR